MPLSGSPITRHIFRIAFFVSLSLAITAGSIASAGTIVRVSTSLGDYSIELLDDEAPLTVQNFLGYVTRGDYDQTYIHRSVFNFVVQGGAFRFQPFVGPITVPTLDPILNEFKESNIRGTVAMAKISGDLDSATNQWFVNVIDNSAALDTIEMTISYAGLDADEIASASFGGDITISASTVELLAAAINDNAEIAQQWEAEASDLGNFLTLTMLDLGETPPTNNLIGADISDGNGGETFIAGDGGFAVFGTVLGEGMSVVDSIEALPVIAPLGTGPFTPSTPFTTEFYESPLDFVYMNVEVVDRFSESVNVYEAARQLLITSLTIDGVEGALSLNMSLVNGLFQINLDSIIRLAGTPDGPANFTPADNRLRFPEIEINWGGTVSTLTNVVMVLTDPANLGFTLESFDS